MKVKVMAGACPLRGDEIDIADLFEGAQTFLGLEQGVVVLCDAGAAHGLEVADFDGLGGDAALFGEGPAEGAQDGEALDRFVVPGAVLVDVGLDGLEFLALGGHFSPLGFQAPKPPLLVKEEASHQQGRRTGGGQGGAQFAGGITGGHLPPGTDAGRGIQRRWLVRPRAAQPGEIVSKLKGINGISAQVIDITKPENDNLSFYYNVTLTPTVILKTPDKSIEYAGSGTSDDLHNFIIVALGEYSNMHNLDL